MVVKENVSLRDYTTLKIGGVARYLVEVRTEEEVIEAVRFAKQIALPHLFLGSGSNLLIADGGFDGVVIYNNLKGIRYIEQKDKTVILIVQAGEILDEVIADTVERGYFGLENLSAIPGTVGATPVQNVGAYGVEVADCVLSVSACHVPTGEIKKFLPVDCQFDYRNSFFKTEQGRDYFITAVHFQLTKTYSPKLHYKDLKQRFLNTKPTLSEIREAVISIRANKFPDWQILGTAGSFFKNPIVTKEKANILLKKYPNLPTYETENGEVKIPLGYVLDNICGLKGYQENKVGLFEKQALVLVNHGEATAEDVLRFVKNIEAKVFEMTEINIEPEVRYVKDK